MSCRPSPAARRARGGLVAVVAAGTAIAGHVTAGGPVPSVLTWALLGVLAGACVVVSRRGWTVPRVVAALVAAQVVVHVASWAGGSGAPADERLTALLPSAYAGTHHASGHAAHLTPGMLLAHAAAVLVAAVLLAGIDRAVETLRALARRLVVLGRTVVPTGGPARLTPAGSGPVVPAATVLLRPVLRHRGPPAVLVPC